MHRLVIAENQAITRESLRLVLSRDGYEVAGQAADGIEAMRQLRAQRPDALILGLRLRRLNGLEVIRRARAALPALKILVLSDIDNADTIARCAQAGASGFVSKTADFSELALALKALAHGSSWFPASAATGEPRRNGGAGGDYPLARLSQRELSVLGYLANGYRIRRIANELALDERTVSTYKARLMEKLGAKSLIDLAEIARRNGLISAIETGQPDSSGGEQASASAAGPLADTHALLDALPYAVSIRSLDGRIVFANRHLQNRLGQHGAEVYGAGMRQQARAFGADEDIARRVESTFRDAVSSGMPYRVDAVTAADGRTKIGVHWGAPLLDDAGSFTKMICGTFDVSGPERMFVELRDESVAALETGQARAAHVSTYGQTIGESIAHALAILDADQGGTQPGGGCSAELRTQLRVAQMHVRHLQALMASSEQRRTEQSDLRQLTREIAATVERDAAPLGIRIATQFQGRGATTVRLDSDGYAQLLSTLLYEAVRHAGADATVALRFSSTLRTGGMADIAVEIGNEGQSTNRPPDASVQAAERAAQTAQHLHQHMAAALGAKLQTSAQSGSRLCVLTMTLPRTARNRSAAASLDEA